MFCLLLWFSVVLVSLSEGLALSCVLVYILILLPHHPNILPNDKRISASGVVMS